MGSLEIYSDDQQEALWFKGLDDRLLDVDHRIMSGSLPDYIKNLLAYDRPDIIMVVDEEPVLVVEKSSEVPSGHNMGQRFGRMVRAAENDVPSIMYFPYLAMKHGTHAGLCYANARYFKAMWEVSRIHNTPFWGINWPCDDDGELINDGTEDKLLAQFVTEFIDNDYDIAGLDVAEDIKEEMQWGYDRSVDVHPNYESLPRSVKIRDTEEVLNEWREDYGEVKLPDGFFDREETLVYKVGMSPENCRREDPYAGMQFVYDYGWCREGPDPSDKHRNLVINVPKVTRETWVTKNPNDPSRKSSQWYATAEAFALKDGVIHDFENLKRYTDTGDLGRHT